MWIIFFAALLLTAACSVYFIKFCARDKSVIRRAVFGGLTIAVIVFGVLDAIFGAWDFAGAFEAMGIVMALEVIIFFILQKRTSCSLRAMSKLLIIALVLELTLFQIPSYRLISGDYSRTILAAADGELENCQYDPKVMGIPVNGTDEVSISFHHLGTRIGTVRINVQYVGEDTRGFTLYGDMNDETGKYYRIKILDTTFCRGSESSQTAVMQLSGKTSSARFRVAGMTENDCCVIKSFEINRAIPFDVSPLRMLLFVLLGTFLYACANSFTMKLKCSENGYFCRVATAFAVILTIYCVVTIVLTEIPTGEFWQQFRQTEGDQITEELVLTFEEGQLCLPYDVEKELLEMDNPYDSDARVYEDIQFLWDHVLYEGKYYSYYGVAPLLLFIPYHLITGYFFPTNIAVMLFSCIGLIFLALIYQTIVKRWFREISTGAYISGLIILMAGCGIWFSAGRPCFYEISISSGFACAAAGAYMLLNSNIIGEGAISKKHVFGSSLLLGLAVLCRPTLAVYALCACVWYLFGYRKAKGGDVKKMPWGYMACAILPLAALGAFQMWYNYSRFGSILEFGIKYSLTVNDFTRSEYHLRLMLIGIYNFLLAPPAFIPDYPYVATPFSMLGVNGYYFKDEGAGSGVLFQALPVFGYLLSRRALKKLPMRRSRLKWLTLIGLPCVVMPVVIVCSAWESGYSSRYLADFSWEIIIGAMAILFFLYTRCKNETIKRIFSVGMGFCAVYSVIVCGVEAFNFSLPAEYYPHYGDLISRFLDPLR